MPQFRVDHALLWLDLIDPIRSSFNCTVYTINQQLQFNNVKEVFPIPPNFLTSRHCDALSARDRALCAQAGGQGWGPQLDKACT